MPKLIKFQNYMARVANYLSRKGYGGESYERAFKHAARCFSQGMTAKVCADTFIKATESRKRYSTA